MFYDEILKKYCYERNEVITLQIIPEITGGSRIEIPKEEIKSFIREILEEV